MSSVGVLKKKSKCFVREKKSKCPKKNFQSVERGKKCKCRISGVREKKWKLKEKFREKKNGKNFAKFVFTGWVKKKW